jgi:all-trans-retinol dehydrogenase (NAD+)
MPLHLPREGLTWEAIFEFADRTALEPLIIGPILAGLLYYPDGVQSVLPSSARRYAASATFISTVKVLLACGVIRRINSILSRVVLNNFTSDSWNFGKEIVVVTGGSSGMGAAIVREVAKTSASVIALDLYPPAQPFRTQFLFLAELE